MSTESVSTRGLTESTSGAVNAQAEKAMNVPLLSNGVYRERASKEVEQAWNDLQLTSESYTYAHSNSWIYFYAQGLLPSIAPRSNFPLAFRLLMCTHTNVSPATLLVPEQDAARAGVSPGIGKRRLSDVGGFIGQIEVFHQLHCLDTLW